MVDVIQSSKKKFFNKLILACYFFSELEDDCLQRRQDGLALHLIHYSEVLLHKVRQNWPDYFRRPLSNFIASIYLFQYYDGMYINIDIFDIINILIK